MVATDVLQPMEPDAEPLWLKRQVDIETRLTESGVQWRLAEFDLVADASDDEHAEAAIREQLLLLIDAYAHESDENLTPGAQELKVKLRETIG